MSRMPKQHTVFSKRDKVVQEWIKTEIEIYVQNLFSKHPKKKIRPCAYCGLYFSPKMRFHFFHRPDCRKNYYRGQFKPRTRG